VLCEQRDCPAKLLQEGLDFRGTKEVGPKDARVGRHDLSVLIKESPAGD